MTSHVMFPMRQDIREAIELGLHMNLDNDLEVLYLNNIISQALLSLLDTSSKVPKKKLPDITSE